MSHIARARAMPKTKSERWEKLVKGLEKHKDHIKTPEALATWRLGAKGMALTKSFKKGWSKTCKLVKRKGFTRKGSIRVKPSMAAICGWRKV
jgi:ribosomal protein L36